MIIIHGPNDERAVSMIKFGPHDEGALIMIIIHDPDDEGAIIMIKLGPNDEGAIIMIKFGPNDEGAVIIIKFGPNEDGARTYRCCTSIEAYSGRTRDRLEARRACRCSHQHFQEKTSTFRSRQSATHSRRNTPAGPSHPARPCARTTGTRTSRACWDGSRRWR